MGSNRCPISCREEAVHICIAHLIRHSLEFVSWKERKAVVPALRAIYRAKDAEAEMKALETFETSDWGQRYPAIALSWRRNWDYNKTGRIHCSET